MYNKKLNKLEMRHSKLVFPSKQWIGIYLYGINLLNVKIKIVINFLIKHIEENNIVNGYLFNINDKCFSQYTLLRIVNKYTKNIDKNISPHTFRHTRAVHLFDNGVNIIYFQELLGYSSITATMEYAKVIEKANPKISNDFPYLNDTQDLLFQLLNL